MGNYGEMEVVIQTQTVCVMYGHFYEHSIVNMQVFLQKIPKNAIFCAFSVPGGLKPKTQCITCIIYVLHTNLRVGWGFGRRDPAGLKNGCSTNNPQFRNDYSNSLYYS